MGKPEATTDTSFKSPEILTSLTSHGSKVYIRMKIKVGYVMNVLEKGGEVVVTSRKAKDDMCLPSTVIFMPSDPTLRIATER